MGVEQCCNFYDMSDKCVSECATNQEPNEDYTCVCRGFFEPIGNCSSEDNDKDCVYTCLLCNFRIRKVTWITWELIKKLAFLYTSSKL